MQFNELFLDKRTCYLFSDKKVSKDLLQEIYDISKYGPTSFNSSPLRAFFIISDEKKKLLLESLTPGNIEPTKSAPVTVIFAHDLCFYEKFNIIFPGRKGLEDMFIRDNKLSFDTAFRNSSLQAAYFMILARSRGLECGPMSGFDEHIINNHFFHGTNLKVNFLCNLGYRKGENEHNRLPRLDFDTACKIM